ncbi:hypothetical protein Q8A73_007173 [Channa argus]|nr:hypothetical protein Q8A73_007173 [Channa argus]
MKKKVAKLRLSPNEEARLLREELERRRKLRIQQVREQQRYIALQIRQEVERRRQQELEHLGEELRQEWERQQREKLQTLQRLYQESLQLLGQGHRSAKENEPDLAAVAQREEENYAKAEDRYREALKELKSQKRKDHEMQSRAINARKKALQAEKERSAKVASLPPPPPNPIQYIDSKKTRVVKKFDVSAFADTHYHMSENTVDREVDTQQPNAHERAELELRRLQDLQKEEKWKREEQLEKARMRGKQALRREQLMQDRERFLVELEHMQQTDLLRRRQQVSQIPPQIFHPLYKRQEMREDFQKEMEFAFEDMYTGERRVKGDLVVQLVPEPLPALSTGSQDQELDVTLDEIATPETENAQPHTEQEAESTEQETSVHVESSKPKTAPRRVLNKLLDRIRSQRSQWTEHNSHVPSANSSIAIANQIPEHDTTIDTGSLTSEDRNKTPTFELPQSSDSASAQKTTEEPISANTPLPDVLANKIQEFEEQKKKEEDLEREKQQQLVMLQELEEQKAQLEQLLIEAQQEREHLKVAVTQDLPVKQPEVPVCDHEVTSTTPALSTVPVLPAGEDEHIRRIREYQQRLLEQNRIHRRSVEVARQRLEKYQRALQIRYNMASTFFVPAETQRPLLSTQAVNHPAPLLLPITPQVPAYIPATSQTSVDIPTREFHPLPSPFHLPAPSVDSKSLPDEVESKHNSHRNQFQSVTAWLTNNIMGKVTEHLPQTVRLSPANTEHLSCKSHHSTSISIQSSSDSIQDVSPSIIDAKSGTLPISSLNVVSMSSKEDKLEKQRQMLHVESLSSREDDFERQRQKLQIGSLSSREYDLENRRQELQEVKTWVLNQKEAVALHQRQQEEHRRRQEVEMEQMRRQKETLQALIHADAQPVPVAAGETQDSDNVKQTRRKLLASLLKVIEESNGGTLSHLEEPQEKDGSPQRSTSRIDPITESHVPARPGPTSVLPSGLFPPSRAAKPPVTRVRLGFIEMTEQHELSAIQEVESPVNTSLVTGREDGVAVPPRIVDSGGVWDLQEESEMSAASDVTLQTPCVTSIGQQTEGPTRPGTSSGIFNNQIWRERLLSGAGTSPESSNSDLVLKIISPLSSDSGRGADYSGPAVYRSHTESSNRPAESDHHSSTTISTGSYITTDPEQNTENSLLVRHCEEQGLREELLNISSPSGQSSCIKDPSAAAHPGLAVHSLFNDSSIQQIIDRYTRELNISLSTVGRTTESEDLSVEEPGSSVSQHSLVQASEKGVEDEGSTCHLPLPSDTAGTQRCDNLGEDMLLAEDPDQDSFRPLIGQLADESSLLTADHREVAMERLVGHPSAHSSMIGPASVSLDQGGWDSTLSRMIGRLSHMSGSQLLSRGQDFYASQLVLEQSSTWLVEGQGESRMRPLVGELDDDQSGSSGERTCVNLHVSSEATVPSYPALHPQPSSQSSSAAGVNAQTQEQTLQNQTDPMDLSPERTEGPVSFRSLLAEFTHNETAEASMTFHLPEHEVPSSPDEHPGSREPSDSTPSEESDYTVQSEPSPELLRAEEQSGCLPALCESFSNLTTSQCFAHESVLMVCDATPSLSMPLPQEMVSEKGILEQSEITLVSLTDTSLQDQDTTITEEAAGENKQLEGVKETEREGSESTLLSEKMPKDKNQLQPVKFLEFQWCPSRDLPEVYQKNCKDLHQKSCLRVEKIKAKRALAKIQPETQALSAARQQSEANESQPLKIKSGPQQKTKNKSKAGQTEQHQTGETLTRQKKAQPPPTVVDFRLQNVGEVKINTTEQRKKEVSEMHQRTQRLYEQLEEVKHQKVIRSRQEAYAKNRLKAKEFHKKTLQKLRAKETQ